MDSIVDLIATNSSPADITRQIKNTLHTKAMEKIEAIKPYVADSMFGDQTESEEDEDETDEENSTEDEED